MKDRTLDHPLEPGGRLRIGLFLRLERLVFLIEILAHHVTQIAQVHAAGLHHLCRVGIVDQRQQQMLQRRVLVAALGRVGERGMQRFFEALCETGHRSTFWLAPVGSLFGPTATRMGRVHELG